METTPNILTQEQREHSARVIHILENLKDAPHAILPTSIQTQTPYVLDLSENNPTILAIDFSDAAPLQQYIHAGCEQQHTEWALGVYGEDRIIYRQGSAFAVPGVEARSLHLAYDLWAPAGTPLTAPIAGRVHSFADNDHAFDYGGTIILEHTLEGVTFYTLYGHVSRASLEGLTEGKEIAAGEIFAWIGVPAENGNWAEHVHFQIITDMLEKKGDYPGVARPSEKEFWLTICPSPSLLCPVTLEA